MSILLVPGRQELLCIRKDFCFLQSHFRTSACWLRVFPRPCEPDSLIDNQLASQSVYVMRHQSTCFDRPIPLSRTHQASLPPLAAYAQLDIGNPASWSFLKYVHYELRPEKTIPGDQISWCFQ